MFITHVHTFSRFEQAISAGRVSAIQRIDKCCVLAAVGQGMVERKGSAATMMSALANADINIKAIAQVSVTAASCGHRKSDL